MTSQQSASTTVVETEMVVLADDVPTLTESGCPVCDAPVYDTALPRRSDAVALRDTTTLLLPVAGAIRRYR